MATNVDARFWAKVDKSGECWIWTGYKSGQGGYGHFHVTGSGPTRQREYAHRWSYVQEFGPIPEEMEIDHLCRNRLCVRPAHLEAVTFEENHARRRGTKTGPYDVGTHCHHGHERTPENTRINSTGARICVLCARAAVARHRRKFTKQ